MKWKAIVRRPRKPSETPTARVAIRNHCLECMGYERSLIEGCTSPGCWLYPWRLGRTPREVRSAARVEQGRQMALKGTV